MNGAEYLVQFLERKNVRHVFGYPGGAIMPVYDALLKSKIKHYLCRHEQGAVLAADGYSRSTLGSHLPGICIATSGPGATNLVTGLANALLDSIPLIAISGQVNSALIGTDGFQEIDTLGLSLAVVKHSFLVDDITQLDETLNQAFEIAMTGRPGPVLIDVTKDVQQAEVPSSLLSKRTTHFSEQDDRREPAFDLNELLRLLSRSRKPVLYLGGGCLSSWHLGDVNKLLNNVEVPFVTTLKAVGIESKHLLNLGMLGMHGTQAANHAIQESDLLIALGVRFDDRATGNLTKFAPNAKVIHVDIDGSEINKLRKADLSIRGDLKSVLPVLNNALQKQEYSEWVRHCCSLKKEFCWRYDSPGPSIYAPRFLAQLSKRARENTFIACDVGQHQMWVAQHCEFSSPNHHLSSGGLGTMGFGLPAAIGAQVANPNNCVINVSGDGSFAMNIQELMTLIRYQLPVKIVLIDNSALGMVRQWQHLFFKDRYSEVDLSDNPDFVSVAKAFGLSAKRINKSHHEQQGINWLLEQSGPCLLQVCINNNEQVWPLVPPGAANHEMMLEENQK
ncbi:MAG: acetolactate synthase 2 catalytic subunit [Gammaproteobacteria bacterium]|nr:acetolactate synthase 2 catalytic subunit [Gammaproteobacteria bacterium]